VALVGDIERGGVIAQLVGTWALLPPRERGRIAGYVVNKFRGDVRLFDGGIAAIGANTGLRCFGVVPWFEDATLLPAEDSLALAPHPGPLPVIPGSSPGRERESAAGSLAPRQRGERQGEGQTRRVRIAVPVLPRIANFDDLDPLRAEPAVDLVMMRPGRPLPRDADVVILPGSKATIADLEFLRREGWDIDILAHRRQGGRVLGLCGGYQMLGRRVADPEGVEGCAGMAPGLGLLDIETVLGGSKRLARTEGIELSTGMPVEGYEMHVGVTSGPGLARPMLKLAEGPEGAVSEDGGVAGCYLHGLFAADAFRRAWLGVPAAGVGFAARIEATLSALADHLERNLDLPAVLAAAQPTSLK
jgi:adenosylcobyric acid synthase